MNTPFKNNTGLALPQVNLNGTARHELIDQVWAASDALFAAVNAVKAMAPHSRDYQTTEPNTYSTAREHHSSRITALEFVKSEIDAISEHLFATAPAGFRHLKPLTRADALFEGGRERARRTSP